MQHPLLFYTGAAAWTLEQAVLGRIRADIGLSFYLAPEQMQGVGGFTEPSTPPNFRQGTWDASSTARNSARELNCAAGHLSNWPSIRDQKISRRRYPATACPGSRVRWQRHYSCKQSHITTRGWR